MFTVPNLFKRPFSPPLSKLFDRPTQAKGGGGVSYDADASALFARFTTPPDDTRKALINQVFVGLKNGPTSGSNIFNKLDGLCLAGADNQATRRNWVQDLYNLTASNGPAFAADRGFTGDGSAAHLTTATAINAFAKWLRDSAHLGVFSLTSGSNGANEAAAGATTASGPTALLFPRVVGNASGRINNGGTTQPAVATGVGHTVVARGVSVGPRIYKDGSLLATGSQPSSVPTSDPLVFLRTGNSYGTYQLACMHWGGELNDAEVLDFYNIVRTYLQAIGAV